MCLILFGYKAHPNYKLILLANRDEFKARPTAKADYWKDHPQILAGRDLERMGTWLGISKKGHFSAITNYREAHENLLSDAPSRGDLTTNFIKEEKSPKTYLSELHADKRVFNGYNLLIGDVHNLYHYSNKEGKINHLDAGIYGLSNALLDTPWPKVELGKSLLTKLVANQDEINLDHAFKILQNVERPREEDLPDTGIGHDWEKVLSSMFIDTEAYGTYCSTVLLWDYKNQIDFIEKVHEDQSIEHFRLQVDVE